MNDLSAKVFRTYNASITLQQELEAAFDQIQDNDTMDIKVKFYNDCNRKVAILCNHQKAVSKNHSEQMQKINQALDEKRHALKMLEDFRKALKTSKEPTKYSAELRKYIEENPAIKTVEQC